MTLRNLLYYGVLALLLGCEAEEQLDPPQPPDTTALLAAYHAPTGVLSAETGPELVTAVVDSLESVQRLARLLGYVQALVPTLTQANSKSGALTAEHGYATSRHALTTGIDAYGVLDHECDDQTGSLQVTAVFDENGLRPEIWGALNGCLVTGGGEPADAFEGQVLLNIDLESGLNTLAFDGQVTRDGTVDPMSFSIQVSGDGTVAMSRPVEGGHLVATLVSEGDDLTLGVVDATGTWHCGLLTDSGTVTCTGPEGDVSW